MYCHFISNIIFFSVNFSERTVTAAFPGISAACINKTHFPLKLLQRGCLYGNISTGSPLSTPNKRIGPSKSNDSSSDAYGHNTIPVDY